MNIYAITSQEVLDRVSRHCPEALCIYLQCLNRVNEKNYVYLTWQNIEIDMSENRRFFLNNIKKLARENLLEWHPFDNGIAITFGDLHADE